MLARSLGKGVAPQPARCHPSTEHNGDCAISVRAPGAFGAKSCKLTRHDEDILSQVRAYFPWCCDCPGYVRNVRVTGSKSRHLHRRKTLALLPLAVIGVATLNLLSCPASGRSLKKITPAGRLFLRVGGRLRQPEEAPVHSVGLSCGLSSGFSPPTAHTASRVDNLWGRVGRCGPTGTVLEEFIAVGVTTVRGSKPSSAFDFRRPLFEVSKPLDNFPLLGNSVLGSIVLDEAG